MKIAIFGAGSWGTTLAVILGRKGHQVTLLGHNRSRVDAILQNEDRVNAQFFKRPVPLHSYQLPASVSIELDRDFVAGQRRADVLIVATPSRLIDDTIGHIGQIPATPIIMASKGMTAGGRLLTDLVAERLPGSAEIIGALSGPNIADEVITDCPSAAVCAFPSRSMASTFAEELSTGSYVIECSTDVRGIMLFGAIKNVISIAAGVCDAQGYRGNTSSVLFARGLAEMAYLGEAVKAHPATILGPAGVGDLKVTMESNQSRNHRLGKALGSGKSLDEARLDVGQEVEGITSSYGALAFASRTGLRMAQIPILRYTNEILSGKCAPQYVVAQLMMLYRRYAQLTGSEADEALPGVG